MHIRDEQKGILFLILIFAIIAGVSVFIARLLRTDTVGKSLENDQVIRTLYVLDDGGGNALMTEVVIYYPVSKKATSSIFRTMSAVSTACSKASKVRRGAPTVLRSSIGKRE